MKRFLSIILCLALVLPGTGAWAAESEGYFNGTHGIDIYTNNGIVDFRDFEQTFSVANAVKYGNDGGTGMDSRTLYTNRLGNNSGKWTTPAPYLLPLTEVDSSASALFEPQEDNKYYYTHRHAGGTNANPNFGPWLDITAMSDGEKVHISFLVKNDDFGMKKNIYYAKGNRTAMAISLVRLGTDGKMTFGYAATGTNSPVSVDYSLNRWYKIDVVLTYDYSSDDTVAFYLDGAHIVTHTYDDITTLDPSIVAFIVDKTGAASEAPSSMGIDNLYAKFHSKDSDPTITQRNFAYSGFDGMHTSSVGADGFIGNSTNTAFTYNKVTGALGKESTDTSMKLTALSDGSADAYEFNITSIKSDGSFAAGSKLKFSTSYAYKTGGGADTFKLVGTSGAESFYTIDRSTGVLSVDGNPDTFTLESEKWYNIDTILETKNDNTLGYTIYVNGISEIEGILNIPSLQAAGAVINKLIFNTRMDISDPGEAYLDDMYAATGTVTANAPIVNPKVDLSENGKIFIPPNYNVADILNDTDGVVKVLRDNESEDSGTAEDTLVVVGDLLPVYGYANEEFVLNTLTAVFSSGEVTVSEEVESNRTAPIGLTLITAVYKDGKIYSVNSKSETCNMGNKVLSDANIAVPEGGTVKIFNTAGWIGAIPDWTAMIPLFDDKVYTASASRPLEPVPDDSAVYSDASAVFKVEGFNFEDLSVSMSGTIGSGRKTTAAVYIVPKNTDITAINDSNPPLFADVITTDENGRFKLTAKFFESGTAFVKGDYDVYVYSKSLLTPLKGTFIADRKNVIFNEVNASGTWDAMKAVILGTDMNGNLINDNFTYINPDKTHYSLLEDTDAFFRELFGVKSSITNYESIKTQFKTIAEQRYIAENTVDFGGGGGGGSFGTGMTTNPPVDTGNIQETVSSYFNDMKGHWAESYVNSLYKDGIVNGYGDGSYAPDNYVTRAELVKLISSAFGINGVYSGEFLDVTADSWYAPYVYGASANGIVTGFEGKFRPLDLVTREDAGVMLHRAIVRTHKLGIGYVFFKDETSISSYAVEQVSELAQIGVITGNEENMFVPKGSLTRAEAAALISRALDYILAH